MLDMETAQLLHSDIKNNIIKGKPLVSQRIEGINGLTISNAMYLSSWLGKEISIPFDEELFVEELNKRRATSKHKETVTEVTFATGYSENEK